jgi:hypothetical protein
MSIIVRHFSPEKFRAQESVMSQLFRNRTCRLHSCLHFFGLHFSDSTIAIRVSLPSDISAEAAGPVIVIVKGMVMVMVLQKFVLIVLEWCQL